jgi:hypothetical protein
VIQEVDLVQQQNSGVMVIHLVALTLYIVSLTVQYIYFGLIVKNVTATEHDVVYYICCTIAQIVSFCTQSILCVLLIKLASVPHSS